TLEVSTPAPPTQSPTTTPTPTRSPTQAPTPTVPPCDGVAEALSFPGSSANVSVPDFAGFPSGVYAQLSVEMWLRNDVRANGVVFAKEGAGAQTLYVWRDGQKFYVNFSNFTSEAITAADTAPLGAWFHFAFAYNG